MTGNFSNKFFLFPLVTVATLIIGLFIFAKFGPGLPLSVVTTTKTDLFTVTGEGKATAVPDIAQINLGITANAATVSQAQSQANSVINKISSDLKKLGVGDKDIRTTSYNLRREYDKSIGGYVVDINLLVKLRQFDKLDQAIDVATKDGANQVGGLSFTLDDATREKVENDARSQAIAAAKRKAEQIAKESGITLGRIINVSENNNFGIRPIPMMAKAIDSAESVPTQIEPGQSEISVTVALSYETR